MKIYKCVGPLELETWTRKGWVIEQILNSQRIGMAPGEIPNPHPRPDSNDNYSGYHGYREMLSTHTPTIVQEPMFLVWKEESQETIETELRGINAKKEGRIKELENELQHAHQQTESYKETGRNIATRETGLRTKYNDLLDSSRKMEEDMGKVRKAIGDLKFKEIVG